jgi:type VI protein secretion system component Hcp
MTEQIRKVSDQSQSVELNDQQLDMIAGGTTPKDQASPNLFKLCATGEHVKTATL